MPWEHFSEFVHALGAARLVLPLGSRSVGGWGQKLALPSKIQLTLAPSREEIPTCYEATVKENMDAAARI